MVHRTRYSLEIDECIAELLKLGVKIGEIQALFPKMSVTKITKIR